MSDFETALRAELAGRYVIERELGRGGMATVYLADDVRHRRQVAIKVLNPELGAVLGAERFLREIGIAARLSHPHILPLHDSGTLDLGLGRPVLFYVMPYVAGRSLRERLREEPQLPVVEALGIARQVADALDHAHRQGVVHRDIKPENILIAEGQAVLADFGIARALGAAAGDRLTETGLAIGTPAYMSPEQASGGVRLDGRTDVYALGCVVYEMLAGQPPFTGPTAQAVMARHAVDPVPSLRTVRHAVPVPLELAVNQALEKVPADRFTTAGEFARALIAPAPPRATRRPLRRELVVGLAAAAAIIAAGVGYAMRRSASVPPANRELVAIVPFRVAGSMPEFAWLREGMVDLLAAKLTGEGRLRAAEPGAVLNLARRISGGSDQEIAPAAALQIGRQIGAGRVIDGGVVGTGGRLTLIASLLASPGGRSLAHASVEGPVDSLAALVDRLAGQLLALDAGVEAARLPSITTTSLPAIRAFVAGRVAFRRGRMGEAFRQFREATLLDSTFALAALELVHASIWAAFGSDDARRGERLAQAGRERLGAGDRALLDVWSGPHPTAPEIFERWKAAADAYPDRAEMWYGLGDQYYHWGIRAGLQDPMGLAAAAFQRGWAIDSASAGDSLAPERSPIFAEPLTHMVEIAQMRHDTASVRRFVAVGLAADSTGPSSWYLRWHRAAALGDSARRAFWADSGRIEPGILVEIAQFAIWSGVAPEDYLRASDLANRRIEAGEPGAAALGRYWLALNSGRPREAHLIPDGPADPKGGQVQRILDALYWGADTADAAAAARELAPYADSTTLTGAGAGRRLVNFIGLAEWRIARGDYAFAERASRVLRTARITGTSPNDSAELTLYAGLCAALFEATRATMLNLSDARARLAQADTAARHHIVVLHSGPPANLIIARLAERQGDLPLALAAVRRRITGFNLGPWYLSTFLREEGRLAALAGDTAGAIRAYQHYLALRRNPEPQVKPEIEEVRADLAQLLAEPRR